MKVNKALCDVCGTCVSVCYVSAIVVKEFEINIDNEKCIKCLNCVKVCPFEAIEEEK
ncbi:MAG TPA: 4Fe-4S binding protein [Candidatus Cloacimonadota bacterium]|nr:4Fe-4S binding protein [Candidatus Cloacimonadales bacterium]HPY95826.1 4Fe-4S binding protein [Candidatus Cloacimonadota bacterium]HQB40528.1 4Fe-4S binding protein [Candidatus Cloacimonadota bacterium]